ncbi:MAG: hypothetical protein JSV90_04235 [Methanobacteriota archaeon]|nr:MAG: hypothetical protein JSV90_04235 [Euryarchaeota archaeon]
MPEEHMISAMYRIPVDKVKAVQRAASGKTRCPKCSSLNPANRRYCRACKAKLYPVEEENDRMYVLEKLQGKED